jgi:hypothetical protein
MFRAAVFCAKQKFNSSISSIPASCLPLPKKRASIFFLNDKRPIKDMHNLMMKQLLQGVLFMEQKTIKPLLYINQPEMREPSGQMQSSFIFSAEEALIEKPQAAERAEKQKSRKKTAVAEMPLSFEEPVPETGSESAPGQEQHTLKPVKSFPNMSIDEKLDHLVSSPQFYYCAFQTANHEYVGKLKEMNDDRITVMTTKGTIQPIAKKELLGIRLIG